MESNGLVSLVQKWNRIKSRCHRFPLWWWYFTGVQKKKVVAKSWLLVISKPLDKANSWTIYRSTVLSTGAPQKLKRAAQSWEVRVISPSLGTTNNQSVAINHHLLPPPIPPTPQSTFPPFLPHPPPHQTDYHKHELMSLALTGISAKSKFCCFFSCHCLCHCL